jgi:hypothetical protein
MLFDDEYKEEEEEGPSSLFEFEVEANKGETKA